jgi:hypothetical protein
MAHDATTLFGRCGTRSAATEIGFGGERRVEQEGGKTGEDGKI